LAPPKAVDNIFENWQNQGPL